nr:BLTX325 [Nephila pilipes]
MERGKL